MIDTLPETLSICSLKTPFLEVFIIFYQNINKNKSVDKIDFRQITERVRETMYRDGIFIRHISLSYF
jgi:hypothetical protein